MIRFWIAAVFILTACMVTPITLNAGSEEAVKAVVDINITSIIMNGIVRVAAILAGVCIVWLGHNTMIRGVKGEFEFEGNFAKLKGSTPGLLFVLLGSMAIGWSLNTPAKGDLTIDVPTLHEQKAAETDAPQPDTNKPANGNVKEPRPSDNPPDFMNPGVKGEKNDG